MLRVGGERRSAGVNGSASKADLVKALNDAMAECDKVYGATTDANATDMIAGPARLTVAPRNALRQHRPHRA